MDQLEDVEVILAHDRHYKFHSGVLARNSTLLAKMLTERNGANLRKSAKEAGVKIRWMIALERLPSDEEPAGSLEWIVSSTLCINHLPEIQKHMSLERTLTYMSLATG